MVGPMVAAQVDLMALPMVASSAPLMVPLKAD
jgi:hypothetical protein